jgi:DNA-binding LacI/PurR family transcriptional regulator
VATRFLGSIVDGLGDTGLALTLLTSDGHAGIVPARDVALDGAIVYSCDVDSESREWLLRRQLPLVFVDQDPVKGISGVNVEDRAGARAAAQHLVELGHRRIGIVNTVIDGVAGVVDDPLADVRGHPPRERMRGWLEALEEAGIEPTVVQTRHDSTEDSMEAARMMLSVEPRPTAVLCFSDVLALDIIRVARSLGITVPDELSVVGFDDSPASRHSEPALTTVRQDVSEKGRLAAEALSAAIEAARAGRRAKVRHRTLPTELVVRESTGPAPHT